MNDKIKYPCDGCKYINKYGSCHLGFCMKWKWWFKYQWKQIQELFEDYR